MTTFLMLRNPILLIFISLNAFDLFNCVEHSPWTYDLDSELVKMTIANGTTYSCRAADIIFPLNSLPSVARVSQSGVNDAECVRMDFVSTTSESAATIKADENRIVCTYPVPTEEEVFEQIEKTYQSSFDVVPGTEAEWFFGITNFITTMQIECSKNEEALKEIESARNLTVQVLYNRTSRLPDLRKEVSLLQSRFEEAKSMLASAEESSFELRNGLFKDEIKARVDDDYWVNPQNTRKSLASKRISIVENVLQRKQLELKVVEARTKMFHTMALANHIVAGIQDVIRDVNLHFLRAWKYLLSM